jgi:hypothetical protein
MGFLQHMSGLSFTRGRLAVFIVGYVMRLVENWTRLVRDRLLRRPVPPEACVSACADPGDEWTLPPSLAPEVDSVRHLRRLTQENLLGAQHSHSSRVVMLASARDRRTPLHPSKLAKRVRTP